MYETIPYALALTAVAGIFWDGHRRRLAVTVKQLSVAVEFEEMKRDYALLKVQTKKAIEATNTQLDEAIKRLQAQINIEDIKRELAQSGRRIG